MSATSQARPRRATRRDADARQAPVRRPGNSRGAAARPARRISGPAAGRARAQPERQQNLTVGARALAVVRSLPDRSLVDRLVRGRAWIPVLGVLLVGIVAMQVEMLKLGTSLGRSLERTTTLQSQNESLQAGVATLADDQRIERIAAGMGMVMPTPGLLTFVSGHAPNQIGKAFANMRAPDPTNFVSQLAALVAQAALITPATSAAATGQSSTSAGTASTAVQLGSSATSTSSAGAAAGTTSGSAGQSSTGQIGVAPTDTGPSATGSPGTGATTTGTGTTGTGTTTGTGAATTTNSNQASGSTNGAGTGVSTGAAGLPSASQLSSPNGG